MKLILAQAVVLLLVFGASTCKRASAPKQQGFSQEPKITVTPLTQEQGQWKITASDKLTISVSAPGAQQVRLLYRPEGTEEQIELTTLATPNETAMSTFSTELNIPPDFAGDLSAEVAYPDGTTKETEAIAVTAAAETNITEAASQSTGNEVDTDESARSDKLTGGRIARMPLQAGDTNIYLSINVPAFQLTLWQSGKEIKTYNIGIGRKNFPLPIGEREANAIIFNPRWIPPDSAWVRRMKGVAPYERIEPDDPRNPLGKIKIPLGSGYLIHEAAQPSDIGQLVSHGCVRMRTNDLFDLAGKIIAARRLSVTREQIKSLRTNNERMVVKLAAPLLVDINYDPQVVEEGSLRLYPDVYDRGTFTLENVRAELQSSGVNIAQLDEQRLKEMMAQVNSRKQFIIRVADIKAGRYDAGQSQPLVAPPSVKKKAPKP